MNENYLKCPECLNEMELVDTTFSNIKTKRAEIGQHTGNVFECENCKKLYLENLLNNELEIFSY